MFKKNEKRNKMHSMASDVEIRACNVRVYLRHVLVTP